MFALFIQGPALVDGTPQYLIVPGRDVTVFTRISDGGKHGLNRWSPQRIGATDTITADVEPTAILLSPRDVRQVEATGFPSTLAIKAQKASEKAPKTEQVYSLPELVEWVRTQDPALIPFVRDARRKSVVTVPVVQPRVEQAAAGSYAMATVPPSHVRDSYINRKVGGVLDFQVFEYAQGKGLNVLLYGPTGPGKTTSAIAYAAHKSLPVFMVSGTVSLEASQLFGRYIPDGVGGFVWQDGGVTELVRNGGVLILDEVNFIPSKIATVLFPLLARTRHITLLDHRGETIQAHPDLLIVGTMNPGYSGTQDLNAAFRNRFSIQVPWGYNDDVEQQLIASKALRDLARSLRSAEAREDLLTPTPTNALIEFVQLTKDLGLDFAIDNFVARYEDSEQSKVKLVLDTYRANIEADLGIAHTPVVETNELADIDLSGIESLADLEVQFA